MIPLRGTSLMPIVYTSDGYTMSLKEWCNAALVESSVGIASNADCVAWMFLRSATALDFVPCGHMHQELLVELSL